MNTLYKNIFNELSGDAAKQISSEICKHYRSFGSVGYHAATDYVLDEIKKIKNLDVRVTDYPLDGETEKLKQKMPFAWEPYSANLSIVSPIKMELVNFESTPSCLAWWSTPTSKDGDTRELIDVGFGDSETDYVGKDIEGNYVFLHDTEIPDGWKNGAINSMEKGAAGIITNYLFYQTEPFRTRSSQPEAVQLLRLPNQLNQYKSWGMSINHNSSVELLKYLNSGKVYINANIQCKTFKGSARNIEATILGSESNDECVMFIAHTSAGTRPGANCASGPALMIEIAKTITKLISSNKIKRPKRSIKFLFVAEGKGSNFYIEENLLRLSKIKTLFCFDSVGHHQEKCKSNLMFYKHPDSSPSFINDYFDEVVNIMPKELSWVFKADNSLSLVNYASAPYTVWSDNHVWTAFGVPSPLIMSWPDKYFHTQYLDASNLDPNVFRFCGVATTIASLEISNANINFIRRNSFVIQSKTEQRLNRIYSDFLRCEEKGERQLEYFKSKIDYVCSIDYQSIRSLATLNNDIESDLRVNSILDESLKYIHEKQIQLKEKIK